MRRLAPLVVLLLVLAGACGSRTGDDATGDDGLAGDEPTDDAGEAGEAGGDLVGTAPNPCGGEGDGASAPADTPGVSDDAIRIGVISDKENDLAPVPTVGVEEAVEAFVAFCNGAGGINGRQLDLVTYDSQIVSTADVTKQACADDLFALVGTGSVQDQQGIEDREGCGLPEVGAYSATAARAQSQDFFTPVPALHPTEIGVGPCRHIAAEHPDAVTKAAMVWTELPAPEVRARQIIEACEAEAGFDFVVQQGIPFGSTNIGPLVSQMKSEGVEHFSMVSAASDTLAVLREMQEQGVEPEVIDLGQQYYDPAVAADAAADGAYVLTNTVPFSEADENPGLQLYQEWLAEVGGDETTLGVQAWGAALLWATATEALGDDLTREGLVEELEGITEWDSGGLHMTANPGEAVTVSCFLYLRIVDGDFVREHPDEGFVCDPDDLHTSTERFE